MIKKQLIMEKALELFAKQGFEATSVQQITEHCGISKGAFYLSFKSKDELIFALMDYFMMQIISDIDYIVNNSKNDVLLYQFYYTTFESFHKHSDFAKILIKEQTKTFNKELILKGRYFDHLFEKSIFAMIDRLFGEEINKIKYDLIYSIKGFLNIYSQLFLFYNVPIDLRLLSQTLVEKTNILAKNMTLPFITTELIEIIDRPYSEELSKEQLYEIIEQKLAEMSPSIEHESLSLLGAQLQEPTFSPAIIKGLLENIRHLPECKGIAYLLRNYFKL